MPSTPRQRTVSRQARRRRLVALAVVAGLCVALLGLAYLTARETSLFALRTVEVDGADAALAGAVRRSLSDFDGESLVALDPGRLEREVETIPSVRRVAVDRQFPHTLEVEVVPERPVAVVRRGEESWLVAASGRVIEPVERGARRELPRIWVSPGSGELEAGGYLADGQGAAAARVLAEVPRGFPVRILAGTGDADSLALVLAGKTELRLGEARDIAVKLRVAAAVLRATRREGNQTLDYLDVSLPTRPVGKVEPQVVDRA